MNSSTVIGVIGAGTMGQGIAELSALCGCRVLIYDQDKSAVIRAVHSIKDSLQKLVSKGKISSAQAENASSLLFATESLYELQADIIIEAIIENLPIKQNLFAELEKVVSKKCILATNTSSLSVTSIGEKLASRNRFAGLHFFNPAQVMKLVEVIEAPFTDEATRHSLVEFCDFLGKKSVLVKDSPGFIVNRVARLYYVEALKIVEEGVADFASIDKLMRGAGFRMGPFELMDLIGIDTNLAVTTSMYHAFGDEPKFKPSPVQQEKVANGLLGKKSGQGFYDYRNEK